MIYTEILAGGKGTRMGTTAKPKQFIEIAGKPIIIHTVQTFLNNDKINRIIVCVPKNWMKDSEELFKKYFSRQELDRLFLVAGGDDRQASLMNGCYFIKEKFGLNEDDVILTHDGVRPFVTQKIIDDNIEAMEHSDATSTVVAATDTIFYSENFQEIKNVPNRANLFYGQSPQTFKLKKLIEIFENLTDEEYNALTDACRAFVMKGEKVKFVPGEYFNMKVTTPSDLIIAEAMMKNLCK